MSGSTVLYTSARTFPRGTEVRYIFTKQGLIGFKSGPAMRQMFVIECGIRQEFE